MKERGSRQKGSSRRRALWALSTLVALAGCSSTKNGAWEGCARAEAAATESQHVSKGVPAPRDYFSSNVVR